MANHRERWDRRFLDLAQHIASWSRDPSTKVGAVIVRPDETICSVGVNGPVRNMPDDKLDYGNREFKYRNFIHAEMNALLTSREPITGFSLYTWPLSPCKICALHFVQAGIKNVISVNPSDEILSRWKDSLEESEELFKQYGITYTLYI